MPRPSTDRRGLRAIYFESAFHHWRLGRRRVGALAIDQHDPWPGDAERGRAIVDGRFWAGARLMDLGDHPWDRPLDEAASLILHGFGWLRDLRDAGGDAARTRARGLVTGWIDTHRRWHRLAWRGDVLGERVASWIRLHDFFCASADDGFRERWFDSLSRQAAHLRLDWRSAPPGSPRIAALRGRVIAAVALGAGPAGSVDDAVRDLLPEIDAQIGPSGGHASRSPARQIAVLRDLIDVRDALRSADRPVPPELTDAIVRMSATARVLRHPDGGLALYHCSTEGEGAMIDAVIARSEAKKRAAPEATDIGYHRLAAARTVVIADGGAPAPLDRAAHASPLAFEMSVGRQRLVVNCGSSPCDGKWESALRASAAHSTLIIDDRNAAEVAPDGTPGSRPRAVRFERREVEDGIWLDGEHDGYVPAFGLLHRRRLFLAATGDRVDGEDSLVREMAVGDEVPPRGFVIRFHLHPRVVASVVKGGNAVLLRLPGGGGWRLSADVPASLNESVYFGAGGRLQRCEQVVLTGDAGHIAGAGKVVVAWSIRREDGRQG